MGFRSTVDHITLAEANASRAWRIYADLAHVLIKRAQRLYQDDSSGLDLEQSVYALDSTTIDLCLNLFPLAGFQTTKAAIKLNTLLDLRGSIPTMISISDRKQADIRVLDVLIPEPGAFYVMDRGYLDFHRLYRSALAGENFVARTKTGVRLHRQESILANHANGVRSNHVVTLGTKRRVERYPDRLCRINYTDTDTGKHLIFFTNNFDLPALVISQLFKNRWQVELWNSQPKMTRAFSPFYNFGIEPRPSA